MKSHKKFIVRIDTADWKAWLSILGKAGGASERAAAPLAELRESLPPVEVSFVRVVPGGFQLYHEAPNAYAPIAIMTEDGITRPGFEVGADENS
jgi:iron complex transport system substrate-binding protein